MSALNLIIDDGSVAAGDRLSGKLSYPTQVPIKEIRVELRWYTEGRGTRDSKVVDTCALDPQQLTIGIPVPFSLQTPHDGPVTYNGSLFRVIWEVRAMVVLSGMLNKKEKQARPVNVVCRRL